LVDVDVSGVSLSAALRVIGASMAARCRLDAVGIALILPVLIGQAIGPAAAQAVPGVPGLGSGPTTAGEPAADQSAHDELRADLERLLQRLEDPEQARELAATLRTLLHAGDAQPGADKTAAGGAETEVREALTRAKPAAAELLARIEEDLRQRVATVRETAAQVYEAAKMVPNLFSWAEDSVDEPAERQEFLRAARGIVTIIGVGLLAMWLVARGLAPARRALVFRERDRMLSRWIMGVLLILLRIAPILVFAIAVNGLILIVQPDPATRVWLSAGVSAIVAVRLGLVLARTVLSPGAPQARLVPLSDQGARVLMTYCHWLLALGVYGYTLISVLDWHGMPAILLVTLDRLIAFALLLSAFWMVMRRRRDVAAAIGRLAEGPHAADTSSIPWRRIGSVAHIFAIVYLWALFVIYIVEGLPLFLDVLTTSVLSLSLLVVLVMALRYVEGRTGAARPLLDTDDEDDREDQTAEPTAPAYSQRSGSLLMVLRVAILVVAVLTFLQVWGLDTWSLITQTGPGQRAMLIFVFVGVFYLLWLGINRLIARYIRRLEAQTGTARTRTRTQTALVLARNAALVALCVIGGMVVLSELGLNIGPLLAGAGVIGVAIGFGAQHLVQDVITGLFNLIEDTFAVGDVVDLAGKSGVVEAVTIRTVRLRDAGGNVHTIPFSAIAVVTNMSKDFSYAVFDIGVAYGESVDHVMQIIKEVAEDLQRDRAYRRMIREPLEMFGVDRLADSAVIIKCRLKVRPASQWMIAREFNRRLKNRFDELGIEFPFPQQTIHFGQDRTGATPPVHVVLDAVEHQEGRRESEAPARQAVPRLAD
jgi:moderate conductance mechanosensitive channel